MGERLQSRRRRRLPWHPLRQGGAFHAAHACRQVGGYEGVQPLGAAGYATRPRPRTLRGGNVGEEFLRSQCVDHQHRKEKTGDGVAPRRGIRFGHLGMEPGYGAGEEGCRGGQCQSQTQHTRLPRPL